MLVSCKLTKDEYNYLLPAIKPKLFNDGENMTLIGNMDTIGDTINRLKGLYDYYDNIPSIVVYNCFKFRSLIPFRSIL